SGGSIRTTWSGAATRSRSSAPPAPAPGWRSRISAPPTSPTSTPPEASTWRSAPWSRRPRRTPPPEAPTSGGGSCPRCSASTARGSPSSPTRRSARTPRVLWRTSDEHALLRRSRAAGPGQGRVRPQGDRPGPVDHRPGVRHRPAPHGGEPFPLAAEDRRGLRPYRLRRGRPIQRIRHPAQGGGAPGRPDGLPVQPRRRQRHVPGHRLRPDARRHLQPRPEAVRGRDPHRRAGPGRGGEPPLPGLLRRHPLGREALRRHRRKSRGAGLGPRGAVAAGPHAPGGAGRRHGGVPASRGTGVGGLGARCPRRRQRAAHVPPARRERDPLGPRGCIRRRVGRRAGGSSGKLSRTISPAAAAFYEAGYVERRIVGLENEYGVTCTLRGQRRLSPAEVARYLFRRVVSWGRSSNVFLENGARLYLDVGSHPEYATPECDSLVDVVAHDKAGERILEGLVHSAEQRLEEEGIRGEIYLFKNNTDSAGNSYGCHENYLVSRHKDFHRTVEVLIPFLVTRQIFLGAGKL